ncbi:MAG: hypothetical protein AUK25_06710 [Desulfobacteraceae bacterium CG2_30_51_40]|nr:MAG: hypothetical protein AUK25_06710 [Desulfobacteraceae bacterium CG2_30_51_40]
MRIYMEMPLLFTVETPGCAGSIPSPSTGEGGVGVIFMFRCALSGHEDLYENAPSVHSSPSTGEAGWG